MKLKDDCLFCKIIKGEIPSTKVFENEKVFAFLDIHPQAQEHFLIIPKFHVDSLAHLTSENFDIVLELFKAGDKIAQDKGLKNKGYRSVINTGKNGGQTVHHLHLHLMSDENIGPRFGRN